MAEHEWLIYHYRANGESLGVDGGSITSSLFVIGEAELSRDEVRKLAAALSAWLTATEEARDA